MAGASSVLAGMLLTGIEPTGEEIGKGGNGVTYKVLWNGTICAAKRIHSVLLEYANPEELQALSQNFFAECEANSVLRHPNLVQFLGLYYPPNSLLPALVMELMFTSLSRYLETAGDLEVDVKISILHDSSLGLRYLHSHKPPIIHRDLTANNILLSRSLTAKVTDLGMAKILDKHQPAKMTTAPGLPAYMPPEALGKSPKYTTSLDVFSFGVLTLHTGAQDWPIPTEFMVIDLETQDMRYLTEAQRRDEYLNKLRDAEMLRPIILDCLQNNFTKRPSMVEVCKQLKLLKDSLPRISTPVKSSTHNSVKVVEAKMASLEVDNQAELLLMAKEEQLQQKQKEIDKLLENQKHNEKLLEEKSRIKADLQGEIKALQEKLEEAMKCANPAQKVVVWVDVNINNAENTGIQLYLRKKYPHVHLFTTTNIDEAVGALKSRIAGVDSRAVTSGRLGEDFTIKVRKHAKLKCKIMVFCMGVSYHRMWAMHFSDVTVTRSTEDMIAYCTWQDIPTRGHERFC
ncbi:uncharacterized protein [Dysidea avara]|uniref:uncharacterized protein n=1 Tax=Dysidea avara TaxID=196820 RepID=UPI00332DD748